MAHRAAGGAIACLAMVASYWGFRIDLAGMRRRFPVSLKGSSLKTLISAAVCSPALFWLGWKYSRRPKAV